MKKITILGHLFREMDIVAHVEISIDSQLARIPNCSFHLESSIFFYHSAPLLLPCPSIFPQIGHSHKDFLTFFLTFFSLASSISISSYFYLFIYLFLVIPFFDREKEVLKFVRITMIFILDKMNDFVKLCYVFLVMLFYCVRKDEFWWEGWLIEVRLGRYWLAKKNYFISMHIK